MAMTQWRGGVRLVLHSAVCIYIYIYDGGRVWHRIWHRVWHILDLGLGVEVVVVVVVYKSE